MSWPSIHFSLLTVNRATIIVRAWAWANVSPATEPPPGVGEEEEIESKTSM